MFTQFSPDFPCLVLLYIFLLTQKDVLVSVACLVRSGQQVTLRAYDRYFSPGRLPVGVTLISFYVDLREEKKTKKTNHTKLFKSLQIEKIANRISSRPKCYLLILYRNRFSNINKFFFKIKPFNLKLQHTLVIS